MSEIRIMSFGFPPKGWAPCNGQLPPINQNQALFSLLGTTYGGDGRTTFGLPNLQARTAIHVGGGQRLGQAAQQHDAVPGAQLLHRAAGHLPAAPKPVRLHVERSNPARHLYDRLGFHQVADQSVYLLLEREPDAP